MKCATRIEILVYELRNRKSLQFTKYRAYTSYILFSYTIYLIVHICIIQEYNLMVITVKRNDNFTILILSTFRVYLVHLFTFIVIHQVALSMCGLKF